MKFEAAHREVGNHFYSQDTWLRDSGRTECTRRYYY